MLKNAQYIYDNIIIADEINTTKKYCKPAQVGVDLSCKTFYTIEGAGKVTLGKTFVPDYKEVELNSEGYFFLTPGTYIVETNEGCQFGPNDTGYVIQRSSLNRCGVTLLACVFDPGFTTQSGNEVKSFTMRVIVENPNGIYIEKNARVGQMIIFENENCDLYSGQFQNGSLKSKLN